MSELELVQMDSGTGIYFWMKLGFKFIGVFVLQKKYSDLVVVVGKQCQCIQWTLQSHMLGVG